MTWRFGGLLDRFQVCTGINRVIREVGTYGTVYKRTGYYVLVPGVWLGRNAHHGFCVREPM